jgi:hypothetical protein
MNVRFSTAVSIQVILALSLFSSLGLASPVQQSSDPQIGSAAVSPVTTITVNSGTDPDTSDSRTCISHSPCTLRRAVIQARGLTASQRPVLIAFNIPAQAEHGYDSTQQIWKIQFSGISSAASASLRYLNGSTIIDGTTQPGGRPSGPKIILVGPGTGQWDGLKLGETSTQNGNEIRGLGFQNFKTHIYLNSGGNLVENCWFGLNDQGTGIVLRGGGANDGSGNTGISVGANVSNNIIRNNVFTGLAGVAAAINGNDTTFSGNYIGTNAQGLVPGKQADPTLVCTPVDWLGGSGLSISGKRNLVENNILAGLRIAVSPPTIQADAIRMSGDNHIIRGNKLGLDVGNNEIGVCGRGIYLLGSTKFNLVANNWIVEPGLSAISLNDSPVVSTTDATTLRSNVIKSSSAWGQIEGNSSPEDAIQVTKSMPLAFRNFKPARVTNISGVTVNGTHGDGSPCPNCVIEIFLDDTDTVNEALSSLAVVTASASGTWTATLPAPLAAGQALRTTSTTAQYNTIAGMSAGTTTGLSGLYGVSSKLFLPYVIRK